MQLGSSADLTHTLIEGGRHARPAYPGKPANAVIHGDDDRQPGQHQETEPPSNAGPGHDVSRTLPQEHAARALAWQRCLQLDCILTRGFPVSGSCSHTETTTSAS